MILGKLKKIFSYLLGKAPELQEMSTKDMLLAKVVLDIHRKRIAKEMVTVPLFTLQPIHAIDHEGAIAATDKRIAALSEVHQEMLATKSFTKAELARYLPSVSGFKVVQESETTYIAYEGNGRLAALQKVFTPADGIQLEVEVYRFRNPKKILRRMHRVRRMNGLAT